MTGLPQRAQFAWGRHFLGFELALSIAATLALAAWIEYGGGRHAALGVVAGQRAAIYGTVASIDGALLGFAIATVTIVLGYAPSERFAILRSSIHYPMLWKTLTSAVRALGLGTLVALAALIVDRDSHPDLPAMIICAGATLLVTVRLARVAWVLEGVIRVVTAHP